MLKNNYIYLLIEREFISLKKPIYKLGRTEQEHNKRMCAYPKGSSLLFQMLCNNSVKIEADLIRQFKIKYKHRDDIGNEYFEGDVTLMIKDIYEKVFNSFKQIKFFNNNTSISTPILEFVIEDDDEEEEEVVITDEFKKELDLVNKMLSYLKISHPSDEGAIVPDLFIDKFEVFYTENINKYLETFKILTGNEESIIDVINKILSLCGDCRLVKSTITKYKLTSSINQVTDMMDTGINFNWYDELQKYRYS